MEILLILITLAIIINASYKLVRIWLMQVFKKYSLGRYRKIILNVFKVNELTAIYCDFRRTLPIKYKIFSSFRLKKKVIITETVTDERGFELTTAADNMILSINPDQFLNSNLDIKEIRAFFKFFSKGILNSIIHEVDLTKHLNDTDRNEKKINNIIRILTILANIFRNKISLQIALTYNKKIPGAVAWDKLQKGLSNFPFWQKSLPDEGWAESLLTQDQLKTLIMDEGSNTQEITELYKFLMNCTKVTPYLQKLYSGLEEKTVHKVKGFYLIERENINRFVGSNDNLNDIYMTSKIIKYGGLTVLSLGMAISLPMAYLAEKQELKNKIQYGFETRSLKLDSFTSDLYFHTLNESFSIAVNPSLYFRNHQKDYDGVFSNSLYESFFKQQEYAKISAINMLALASIKDYKTLSFLNKNIPISSIFWADLTDLPLSVIISSNILNDRFGVKSDQGVQLSVDMINNNKIALNKAQILDDAEKNVTNIAQTNTEIVSKLYTDISELLFLNILGSNYVVNDSLVKKDIRSFAKTLLLNSNLVLTSEQITTLSNKLAILNSITLLKELRNSHDLYTTSYILKEFARQTKFLSQADKEYLLKQILIVINNLGTLDILPYNDPSKMYSKRYYLNIILPFYNEYANSIQLYEDNKFREVLEAFFVRSKSAYELKYLAYNIDRIKEQLDIVSPSGKESIDKLYSLAKSQILNNLINEVNNNLSFFANNNKTISSYINSLNAFEKTLNKYKAVLEQMGDILSKLFSDPKSYIEKRNELEKDIDMKFDKYISSLNLDPKISTIVRLPIKQLREVANSLISLYVNEYWTIHISPIYDNVYSKFPFNVNSTDEATTTYLTEILAKGGAYDGEIHLLKTQFALEEDIINYLYPSNKKQYLALEEIKNTLWDKSGVIKPLDLVVSSVNGLVVNNQNIKPDKPLAYIGLFSYDNENIYNMGINNIKKTFKINWWETGVCSIEIVDTNNNMLNFNTNSGSWSCFKLLKQASNNNNVFTWKFKEGNVSFYIPLNSFMFNK
ncbi:hypothetical protein IB642_01250 [Allofrancisella guangzhouensis]|uniref:Uncharacterized protein n=1 Tax=Allofrancisella guangzhouensis TaxID=594679 RepID=A0A0A8E627_9GAMM|nr:hypothetical protein [Allofrancisella guangzhouensis]AJC49429.1 hypothetical protein SD28_07265 [Allofrancisella guangzhouensis]MBK2026720.1 hypothetical protein [Allofrancisella guangzhouensis]MBK2043645.1 hypothetical protein [Allofrancisella guangzhouensis]MBK2046200.1 hypothetical protein [Allofrancisella guangzhouensis]